MEVSGRIGSAGRILGFVVLCSLLHGIGIADAASDPKPAAKAAAQLDQSINNIIETQKGLASSIADLREELGDLKHPLSEQREEQRQKLEATQALVEQTLTQIKEMREEVRGLYVESSGIKGDIAVAAKQVETLDASLGSFRLSAGIIVALVVVLQVVLMGLTLRSRG